MVGKGDQLVLDILFKFRCADFQFLAEKFYSSVPYASKRLKMLREQGLIKSQKYFLLFENRHTQLFTLTSKGYEYFGCKMKEYNLRQVNVEHDYFLPRIAYRFVASELAEYDDIESEKILIAHGAETDLLVPDIIVNTKYGKIAVEWEKTQKGSRRFKKKYNNLLVNSEYDFFVYILRRQDQYKDILVGAPDFVTTCTFDDIQAGILFRVEDNRIFTS